MNEKFWKFMDSAKGFWSLIASMLILGVAYMFGAQKVIDKIMERRRKDVDNN